MPAPIAEALARCLGRVEAGEVLSVVLADHPTQAEELRSLVEAAAIVREHRPVPSASFRRSLEHALIALPASNRTLPLPRRRPTVHAWTVRAVAAMAAGVFAFSGLAAASADSRPGDVLYPVRRGVERIHDVVERVAPPIGRAIDYLTIRTVNEDPDSVTPEPTVVLAPGSSVLPSPNRNLPPENALPPADETGASAGAGRRSPPNPGVIVVGVDATAAAAAAATAATRGDDAARAAQWQASQVATAAAAATAASDADRAAPTATPRRSRTPAAPTATPPTVEPPTAAVTAVPSGAPGGMHGTVTGHEGNGLPGAMVSVYPIRDDGEPRWGSRSSVRTQPDGSYAFGELAPGRYKMAVGELAPWVWRVWYKDTLHVKHAEPIVVQPGRVTDEIDVRLRRNPWSFGGWRRP